MSHGETAGILETAIEIGTQLVPAAAYKKPIQK